MDLSVIPETYKRRTYLIFFGYPFCPDLTIPLRFAFLNGFSLRPEIGLIWTSQAKKLLKKLFPKKFDIPLSNPPGLADFVGRNVLRPHGPINRFWIDS